jgi:protein transport protein SEC24
MQCALLFTTVTGERRIRVHTLSLPCTNVLGNLFRSADLDAQLQANIAQVATALLTVNTRLQPHVPPFPMVTMICDLVGITES